MICDKGEDKFEGGPEDGEEQTDNAYCPYSYSTDPDAGKEVPE